MMNILITSAGRRVSLIKAFKKSSKLLKTNSKVFTTDLDPKTSLLQSRALSKIFSEIINKFSAI